MKKLIAVLIMAATMIVSGGHALADVSYCNERFDPAECYASERHRRVNSTMPGYVPGRLLSAYRMVHATFATGNADQVIVYDTSLPFFMQMQSEGFDVRIEYGYQENGAMYDSGRMIISLP